jgi:hypothetical protein
MLFVISFDHANTLLGQPSTFWQHPETMNEHNQLIHSLATHGYWPVIIFMLAYTAGAFVFVSFARTRLALAGIFAFILCHFHGGSSWVERHWGFGNTGFVIYGILLATVMVVAGFPKEKEGSGQVGSNKSTAQVSGQM